MRSGRPGLSFPVFAGARYGCLSDGIRRHFEVDEIPNSAIRTTQIFGNLGEGSAWREPLMGFALCFVIPKAAAGTLVNTHDSFLFLYRRLGRCRKLWRVAVFYLCASFRQHVGFVEITVGPLDDFRIHDLEPKLRYIR